MRKFNSKAEVIAIKTILDGKDALRNKLLTICWRDHFGYQPSLEVFDRISSLMQAGNELPSSIIFSTDPILSDSARALLAGDTLKAVHTEEDAQAIFRTLDEHRKVRHLLSAASQIADTYAGSGEAAAEEGLNVLETELVAARRSSEGIKMLHAGMGSNAEEKIKKILESSKPPLIRTGFKVFDTKTGGFARGNLVILASNYGGGKSVTGMQMALNMYYNPARVALVTLEMDEDEYMERVLANVSGVQHDLLRRRAYSVTQKLKIYKAWKEFEDYGELNEARFTVFAQPGLSTGELLMYFKPLAPDVLIVDYLNLLDSPKSGAQQWEELGATARQLKILGGQLNCVVVALTQMNEDMQVKYSRAIAEHANYVWMWRYTDDERATHIIRVIQHKARNAPLYDFYLSEDFATMSVNHHDGPADYTLADEDDDEEQAI